MTPTQEQRDRDAADKNLREEIRAIYRKHLNGDPPYKEEIDFGVACFKYGRENPNYKLQADALAGALERILGTKEYSVTKEPHKAIADEALMYYEKSKWVE